MADISWSSYVLANVTINLDLTVSVTRLTSTTATVTVTYNASIPNADEFAHDLYLTAGGASHSVRMKSYGSSNYGYSGSTSFTVTGLSESGGTLGISAYFARTNDWGSTYTSDTRSTSKSYGNTVPAITQTAITEVGATSIKINAYSDISCNTWQYKLNSGSWTTFNSGASTNVSYTISGLTPSTSYTVQIRATGATYGAVGTSGTKTATTLGGMVINSAEKLTVYSTLSECKIKLGMTFYNASYTNYVDVKNGTTTLFTLSLGTQAVGTRTTTFTLTTAQRTAILNAITSAKTATLTVNGRSLSGSTQIGSTSTKNMSVEISSDYAPTFATPTYEDSNSTTVAVTSDNQNLIKGQSTLNILGLSATLLGGASFAKWTFTVGNTTKTSSSNVTSYSFGTVDDDELVVTLTDSRGYTAEKTISITVTNYTKPTILNASLRRVNNVDTDVKLTFNGSYTAVGSNAIQTAKLNINSTDYPLTLTYSGTSYSFNAVVVSLSAENEYTGTITIADKLNTVTLSVKVPRGKPLVHFEEELVEIGGDLHLIQSGTTIDMTISSSDWSSLTTWYNAN